MSVATLVLVVLLAGCGNSKETAAKTGEATETAAATTAETETAATETAGTTTEMAMGHADGHELYVQAGCGGCHGENAQGTEVGPALPGHGEDVVIRQVRSPLDKMPAYSPARLSDEDLHEIAEYIGSLAPTETHIEPVKLSDLVATHHWMALSAIEAGDAKDALHHVNHIIGVVKGKHLTAMKEAREHLEAGDLHEAEHLIEGMLAGTAKPDLSLKQLHLRLALGAIESDDAKGAIHQINHFLELASASHDKSHAREVLEALKKGDLHETEHELEHLLEEASPKG